MQIWNLASRTHICQMRKIGICNFSLYLSLPSLADLPTAVVLLCPAQIIAISTILLLMTKLALSPSPSLSSVPGLKFDSWYIEVPVVSFESHGGEELFFCLFYLLNPAFFLLASSYLQFHAFLCWSWNLVLFDEKCNCVHPGPLSWLNFLDEKQIGPCHSLENENTKGSVCECVFVLGASPLKVYNKLI